VSSEIVNDAAGGPRRQRMNNCDCALRSFWDGPCEYHTNHPLNDANLEKKFCDYGAACQIELNKVIDPFIEEAAKELGWQAGRSIDDSDVDKEFHIFPMPPIPAEAWKFIEEAQKAVEVISGSHEQEKHN
jgi:hypothetical protein